MRQVVSMIKDNQAHFALVDDEDGSIIPFADLLIPDPDRFGFNETATLGSNLINALGLNGTKRPKARNYRVGDIQPGNSPQQQLELDVPERPALPPAKAKGKAKASDKRGPGRPRKDGQRNVPDPANRVQRYISLEEVVAAIDPKGSTAKQIATIIDHGAEPPAKWILRTVENRLAQAEAVSLNSGRELPFRVDRSERGSNGQQKRVVFPV